MQCSISNFKHLSQVVLKQKIVFIFSYVLLMFKLRTPPGVGPFWTMGMWFENPWERTIWQCYISNFMHLGQVVLKKKIFLLFSMYFSDMNLGVSRAGHFGQGSYRGEKTKFPDISLTQIQISLMKTIGNRQNIFSPKLLFTMRQ